MNFIKQDLNLSSILCICILVSHCILSIKNRTRHRQKTKQRFVKWVSKVSVLWKIWKSALVHCEFLEAGTEPDLSCTGAALHCWRHIGDWILKGSQWMGRVAGQHFSHQALLLHPTPEDQWGWPFTSLSPPQCPLLNAYGPSWLCHSFGTCCPVLFQVCLMSSFKTEAVFSFL